MTAGQQSSIVRQESLACPFDRDGPDSIADPAVQPRLPVHPLFLQSGELRPKPPLVDRELTLFDMLDDPIVIRVMLRDGVARREVLNLFAAPKRDWLCRAA
jgi:hypothetical protein